MISFGSWTPDKPTIYGPHLRQAKNVIPTADGYGPFKALVAASSALSTRVAGAGAFRDVAGAVHVYAGDQTALYELNSSATWDNVSAAPYALVGTSRWRFTQFGDKVIATDWEDAIQVKTMSGSSNFAALGGSPPRAKHIATFRDFVVLGYTSTSASEIAWSAINDVTGWTPGTSQSDTQLLPDGGFVQGFATGDVLLIFQQRKIRVMQYVGPPLIMQIDVIEESVGCLEAGSICQHGRKVFYLADDGFHMIDSLQASVNIGEEKINDFFADDLNEPYLYRMSSGVDPDKNIAYWCYPSTASTSGVPDTLLIYYWPAQKWTIIRTGVELVFSALALGYTLEGLDVLAPSGLDLFQIPLDDPILQGGSLRFGAFSTSYAYGVFVGATLEATIETGDIEIIPGKRAYVSGFRPVTDGDAITGSVAARERAMDTEAYTSDGTLESHGMVSVEASGRYFRAKEIHTAGDSWTITQGLDFEYTLDGEV